MRLREPASRAHEAAIPNRTPYPTRDTAGPNRDAGTIRPGHRLP
jgi:hypothetical protein